MDSESRDATWRTRLANERTYLAWWRTGLTAVAVAFGAGKLVPEVAGGTQWPYETIVVLLVGS
jgi:putative membrane protein